MDLQSVDKKLSDLSGQIDFYSHLTPLNQKEEQDKLQMKLTSAAELFMTVFHMHAESNWRYFGNEVEYGDANKPIFWFKPWGVENYSVIYGDLSVENMAPKDLPE